MNVKDGKRMEIRGEWPAVLIEEPGSFREALRHMLYRLVAIQSQIGCKGGNYTDMLAF